MAAPEPVGEPGSLIERLRQAADGASIVLGLDMPLGLPRAFVAAHGGNLPASFLEFLRTMAPDAPWYRVCAELDEISAARPFYPLRGAAGMSRSSHARALGLEDFRALSRLCDRATPERPAGAPLFWTLGPNQTGKAALAGWRDLVIPAMHAAQPPRLWPFEGDLSALAAPGQVVMAETYPAEAARHLGVRMAGSKQRQVDRAAAAPALTAALERGGARPAPELLAAIGEGFSNRHGADDGFDSLLGVLCVMGVMDGRRAGGLPAALADDPWIRRWEGWVLGQTAVPLQKQSVEGGLRELTPSV